MRLRCAAANGLWLLAASRDALAFRRGLDRVAAVQERLLLRTLRRNGFGHIRGVREFQQAFPIRTYDEYDFSRGLIEPVERWEPTSGSSGAAKRIPYTRSLRREFGAAISPWIADLFATDPHAFAGEAYWSVSPGAESDEEALGPLERRLVRAVQAVPRSVRLSRDIESFRRETMHHLTRCRTLSLISVWHPSFLDLLIGDDIDTEATWPRLRVISCWADANAAGPAARLAERFPHATIQPKGLLLTEGVVTIPYGEAHALAYRSHFFEFRDGSDIRLATELDEGKRYQVIITTGGGLYRYDTEDLVEVLGFRGRCPLLRFVGRAAHVSDHFGEKLNEIFVRERMAVALAAIPHDFAMLACDGNAYVLYVESRAEEGALERAAAALEVMLRESHHYDHCRLLGQLRPLRVMRVVHAASRYLAFRAESQVLGTIKIPALDREQGWSARFDSPLRDTREPPDGRLREPDPCRSRTLRNSGC